MTRGKHTPGLLRVDVYHGDNGKTELYRLQATVGITADGILRRADADLYAAAPQLLKALERVTYVLGLVHDFGTATADEGALHPDIQNRALDEAHDLIAAIKLVTGD